MLNPEAVRRRMTRNKTIKDGMPRDKAFSPPWPNPHYPVPRDPGPRGPKRSFADFYRREDY